MENNLVWFAAFFGLYAAYCLYWGVRGAQSSATASDYFLDGRRLSPGLFMLAATAASFAGWALIGLPGDIHEGGFPHVYASLAATAIPLTGLLFFKRQWLLGQRFGFVTPGDMVAYYFRSESLRLLVVIVALAFSTLLLGVQLHASGILLDRVTDGVVPATTGMIVLAVILAIHTSLGGFKAAIRISALQGVLLIVAVAMIGVIVLNTSGGFGAFNAKLDLLAVADVELTPDGYSHYLAIADVIRADADGLQAAESGWTSTMILGTLLAMMGLQAAPAFSMWAFANRNPSAFAPQQVWVSSGLIGFLLLLFATIQGLGSHFLKDIGALDPADLGLRLVPTLIAFAGDTAPWLGGLLAAVALIALQAAGGAFLSTTSAMLSRDLMHPFFRSGTDDRSEANGRPGADDAAQKLVARAGAVLIVIPALLLAVTEAGGISMFGGLAFAYGLQMWPSLIAICFWPFLTRPGITLGLIGGLVAVTLSHQIEVTGVDVAGWIGVGRLPLTIHAAALGLLANLVVAVTFSALLPDNAADLERRASVHGYLRRAVALPADRRALVPMAWMIVLVWFFFAIGPGAMIGNWIFGDPMNAASWYFGIPSIWAWQFLFWGLGVVMMWFLAYIMQMSTIPNEDGLAQSDDMPATQITLEG